MDLSLEKITGKIPKCDHIFVSFGHNKIFTGMTENV